MPVSRLESRSRVLINQLLSSRKNEDVGRKEKSGRGLTMGFPKLCKWNAFTIDRLARVCKDGQHAIGKSFPLC